MTSTAQLAVNYLQATGEYIEGIVLENRAELLATDIRTMAKEILEQAGVDVIGQDLARTAPKL